MTTIPTDIIEALDAAGVGSSVRLILTCDGPASSVVQQLDAAHVTVRDTITDWNIVIVDASQGDLAALEELRGVAAIERDREERAL